MFAVTLLVGMGNEAEKLPGSTVTAAGGLTIGELLERLTTAPPAGACPLSITMPCGCAPPLMVAGEIVSDFNEGGCKVNCAEAEAELSAAVIVTGVAVDTCPACTWNCVQAVLPGIAIVAGCFAILRMAFA